MYRTPSANERTRYARFCNYSEAPSYRLVARLFWLKRSLKVIDLEKHAEELLEAALAHGGDLAEIYFESRQHTSIAFDDNKVDRVITGTDLGVGIRLLAGDRTLYGHTNELSLDRLTQLAKTVGAGVSAEKKPVSYQFEPVRHALPVKQPPQDVPTPRKIELVREANAAARAHDPRIAQVSVHYADALKRVIVVNSEGRYVEDLRPGLIFMVSVVGRDGAVIQSGHHYIGAGQGFELFEEEGPVSVARKAARQAALMLDADPAPTGRMPVVLSSEAGGTMIHEAVGHGLEADHIEKNMSKYCGRLGEMIAVPAVTVIDDGTLPGKRGTCSIDDEGTAMERTVLIDAGRLVRFMTDLRTARKLDLHPSGNGRRQSYEHKPIPRMTNTMIAPGQDDPAAILAGTERGLFVRKMGGGQVNPLNGDYVFEVTEGYIIQNGEPMTPVRGATLIGNGPSTLLDIEGVGNDLGFAIGTCGKEGQGVPVGDAQPTLRIRELTVGGTQQG
ncbi:MAG: TldD/PmbA family protein [Candidatus Hydrogenedentes bacterium]|nr:TldD/PmbA family protein [Candidatus Hydrogenedentota bacterium]